jgi:hypothetical protein
MRLEEHVWVPTVEDPGRFGDAGAKAKSLKEDKEGRSYEDVGPRGNGPVPAAKPIIMSTVVVEDNQVQGERLSLDQLVQPQVQVLRKRTGFLDENMNNAWIPGPVASFKFEEGYTTPHGKVLKAEDGVSGVFGDQILPAQQYEGGKQNMKSITMVVPDTYAPSEGMAWYLPEEAGAVVAPTAPAMLDPRLASLTPGSVDEVSAMFRLDNPNNPGHNILPVDEEEATRRVVVKGRKHVYETYHPPPRTSTAVTRDSDRERESVHERMEKAKGMKVCMSFRHLHRRSTLEDDNDNIDVKRGLEGHELDHGAEYVYAHPGCLKCREREEVIKARVEEERKRRKRRKRRAREFWDKRTKEMEDMFASVGLGRDVQRRDEFEAEPKDYDKDIVLDLNLEEENTDDDDFLDSDDVRSIERDIPSCEETAEDVIVTGGVSLSFDFKPSSVLTHSLFPPDGRSSC